MHASPRRCGRSGWRYFVAHRGLAEHDQLAFPLRLGEASNCAHKKSSLAGCDLRQTEPGPRVGSPFRGVDAPLDQSLSRNGLPSLLGSRRKGDGKRLRGEVLRSGNLDRAKPIPDPGARWGRNPKHPTPDMSSVAPSWGRPDKSRLGRYYPGTNSVTLRSFHRRPRLHVPCLQPRWSANPPFALVADGYR